ncbi:hypothetical protein AB0J80_23380 [Actinoplanes sp. NPDC049548]|uniref:hypothetical protein n=1 Tax=Actinoplanes sp. NPDC049548 TaxID=3155152 RepID=UPI003412A4B6
MSESPAVVEFGPEPPPSRRAGFLTGLATDRRIVPLAAALGALALFASLVSEWQVTKIDATVFRDIQTGSRTFGASVAELDGWGAAYLVGFFLLAAGVVLTLFGPAPGRGYARLTALSTGGVMLAIVAAMWSSLDETSWIAGQLDVSGLDDDQIEITMGRGPWCAAVGIVLVLLALYLAGRRDPEAPAAWSWRRPAAEEEEEPPDAPFELSVTPAQPWSASEENRDKPT